MAPATTLKPPRCIVEFGINYPGNDLTSQKVSSANDCCALCNSNSKCGAWSFYISFNYCYLKSSAPSSGSKQPYDGIWSGVIGQ